MNAVITAVVGQNAVFIGESFGNVDKINLFLGTDAGELGVEGRHILVGDVVRDLFLPGLLGVNGN